MSVSESDTKPTEVAEDTKSTEVPQDAEQTDARAFDAEGRYRPRFVLDFPSNADLDTLVDAFERGDFRSVNVGATALREKNQDPAIRAACEELLLRIRPDPLVKALLGISVLLFVALVAWSYLGHA